MSKTAWVSLMALTDIPSAGMSLLVRHLLLLGGSDTAYAEGSNMRDTPVYMLIDDTSVACVWRIYSTAVT